MEIKDILSRCDHTLLAQTATWEEIRALCDEGIRYGTASVCIPPCYVRAAKEYVEDRLTICTVIGFPNGYNTSTVKCFEAELLPEEPLAAELLLEEFPLEELFLEELLLPDFEEALVLRTILKDTVLVPL